VPATALVGLPHSCGDKATTAGYQECAGSPRARWPRLLAHRLAGVRAEVWCALLLVMGANMLSVVARKSLTNDEVVHIPAAYAYLTRGNFRLNNEHPPLAQEWAARSTMASISGRSTPRTMTRLPSGHACQWFC